MKMADGGYRPTCNDQIATGADSRVILRAEAVTLGSDMAQLTPKIEQLEEHYGQGADV